MEDREMNFSECVLIPLSLIPSTRHRCSLKCWMECVARARDCLCAAPCSFRSHQKRLTTSWLLMLVLQQSVGPLLIRKSTPFFCFLLTALCFRSRSWRCWSLSQQWLGGRQEYTLPWSPVQHRTHTHAVLSHTEGLWKTLMSMKPRAFLN